MDDDLKEIAKKVLDKKISDHPGIGPFKAKYEEYKGLYENAKSLLDPDTRSATLFKESLGWLMKRAGKFVGTDLTKHPYFVLNKAGLDALFAAVSAMDTINNARQLLADGEKNYEKFRSTASEFVTSSVKSYDHQVKMITVLLTEHNSFGTNWVLYVRAMWLDHFQKTGRADAESEVQAAMKWADTLLDELKWDLGTLVQISELILQKYVALSAVAASIVLAEKMYNEKIAKLSKSDSTVSSSFGKFEQGRRWNERTEDALYNTGGGGKSLADRVRDTMSPATNIMNNWRALALASTSSAILSVGSWSGTIMPWELKLPDK